jgi:hypothetical protein
VLIVIPLPLSVTPGALTSRNQEQNHVVAALGYRDDPSGGFAQNEQVMRSELLTHHALAAALRSAGCHDISHVHLAMLENNGPITVCVRPSTNAAPTGARAHELRQHMAVLACAVQLPHSCLALSIVRATGKMRKSLIILVRRRSNPQDESLKQLPCRDSALRRMAPRNQADLRRGKNYPKLSKGLYSSATLSIIRSATRTRSIVQTRRNIQ